ncbi:hypothetical protein, partial [Neisseria sp. P0014.S004]|uniref:hypothetical protein n=1 Tax=Neisseria sp. P0014.S004 TaxID=3436750 RepID=UPI003F7E023D
VMKNVSSEICYARENNFEVATKLATVAYPQTTYTLAGVSVTDAFYFWVRIVDNSGNAGEFSAAVAGRSDPYPSPILAQMRGRITK